MSRIEITAMRPEHVPAVAELEKACFADPWPQSAFALELDNPLSDWLVALDGARVVGYVGSQTAGGETDMMNVAVCEDHRGQGVAALLITALQKRLSLRASAALSLEVRKSNLPAIRLYEKMGFRQVGLRPRYYFHPTEDALIYRKEMSHEDPCV